jgi:hypothetical protein
MARLKGQLKAPTEAFQALKRYDRTLLYGLPVICDYLGCNPTTLRSWVRKHSFPAAKLPNGCWMSSTQLIDNWIVSRNPYLAQFSPQ